MSNFYKIIFCFLLCSLHPHTHSLLFFICNYFLSFVIFVGPRPRHKKAAGGHSDPTQVTAPASLSLCHHGSSQAIRPDKVPHCLSPEGEPFSQQQGGLLGSEAEVSLAHCKSPLLPQKGEQKLDSKRCSCRMWDANPGRGAASCELSE